MTTAVTETVAGGTGSREGRGRGRARRNSARCPTKSPNHTQAISQTGRRLLMNPNWIGNGETRISSDRVHNRFQLSASIRRRGAVQRVVQPGSGGRQLDRKEDIELQSGKATPGHRKNEHRQACLLHRAAILPEHVVPRPGASQHPTVEGHRCCECRYRPYGRFWRVPSTCREICQPSNAMRNSPVRAAQPRP